MSCSNNKTLGLSKCINPIKKKLQRNDNCFCNSGKKYKKCCLTKINK